MRRRVLITGGLGYIGSRAALHLDALAQYEIVLGTRGRSQPPVWLSSARAVHMDWNSIAQLESVCSGVDAILHLAAMNENDCVADPVGALVANGVATARLVEAAKNARVRRFVYLSTAHVYGSAMVGCITETTLPRPNHPYATSHRAAEDCVLTARDAGKIDGLVLRLSNGFGAPVHPEVNRWTLLVNELCRQAVTERRLALRSAGRQRRDFITLSDASRALEHSLSIPADSTGDGMFNVGGECALRVVDVAEEIVARCAAVLGFSPALECPPARQEEVSAPLDYRIDKFKATGFALSGSRTAEIDATLMFCQEHFSSPH